MNMHDPRIGGRMESAAHEARILSQNPQLRRRGSMRNRLVVLLVMIAVLAVVIIWMSSTSTGAPVE